MSFFNEFFEEKKQSATVIDCGKTRYHPEYVRWLETKMSEIRKGAKCQCSRCTGLPSIEDYYDDQPTG